MSSRIIRNLNKEKIHEIIFEADTKEGKLFDVVLLIAILASVIIVMLESVPQYGETYSELFFYLEWFFTILFSIEYILRLYSVYRPMKYVTSFFGIIDLLSILPAFLGLVFAGSHSLMIVRGFRLIRVFRIFKLGNFMNEGRIIIAALQASKAKIMLFMIFVLILVSFFGSIMYLVESKTNAGFDSIPRSVYWAIVTLTTVGYGDISPQTTLGQFIASIIMIAGYAIIAVPTGIVTNEVMNAGKKSSVSNQSCRYCSLEGQDLDAIYCKHCGERLNEK